MCVWLWVQERKGGERTPSLHDERFGDWRRTTRAAVRWINTHLTADGNPRSLRRPEWRRALCCDAMSSTVPYQPWGEEWAHGSLLSLSVSGASWLELALAFPPQRSGPESSEQRSNLDICHPLCVMSLCSPFWVKRASSQSSIVDCVLMDLSQLTAV